MPEYKKKKVHKITNRRTAKTNKSVESSKAFDISMSSKGGSSKKTKSESSNNKLHIVKGRKLEKTQRLRAALLVILVVALVTTLLSFVLPVGIAENISNTVALIGTGSYPVELYGTETLNSVTKGAYYYVLTDTNLSAFANGGKKIYSYSHGFSKPVLKTSATRALVFEQGGNKLIVYNLQEQVNTFTSKSKIITAAISRTGAYAVVTESDSYASVVSVYSRKDKLLYEWYSATETVNNIAISPSGKKIAVSTVTATNGSLSSKVYVLGFESADALYTMDLGEKTVYSIEQFSNSSFTVLAKNLCSQVRWSKFTRYDYPTHLELDMFRSSSEGALLVFNRESNRSDNHIVLLSKNGKVASEFDYNQSITDIQLGRGRVFCITDTTVSVFDKQGKVLSTADCPYGCVRLSIIGNNRIAAISDSDISKIHIAK